MEDLDHLVRSNPGANTVRVGLFEAPTGFGKTIAVLAALLPHGKRIVYLTRTHTQMAQVAQEIRRINTTKGLSLDCVVRGSRRWLCLAPEIRQSKEEDAVEKCLASLHHVKVREARLTDYVTTKEVDLDPSFGDQAEEQKRFVCESTDVPLEIPARVPLRVPVVADIDALVQFGQDHRICPYFLSKLLVRHRKIVISPYNYLFRSDLPLWKNFLVFDEAHNIEKVCKDTYSFQITEASLEEALHELSFCAGFSALNLWEVLEAFRTAFQHLNPKRPLQIMRKQAFLDFFARRGLTTEYFETLRACIADFTTTRKELAAQRGRNFPMQLLKSYETLQFLKTLIANPSDPFVGFLKRGKQGTRLSWVCLDPSLAFHKLLHKGPHTIVLMSGTLAPIQSLVHYLQIPHAHTRSYSSIVPPANIKIFTLATGARGIPLSTKYTRRKDPQIAYGYGKTVELILTRVPHGSLVFFPSYSVMEHFLAAWRRGGILDTLAQGATLFFETLHAGKRVIEAYKETAQHRRAVLFAVCRGTLAEGVDFPDETGRAVLILGVPYPDLSDPRIKAQQEYYEAKVPGVRMGKRWYLDEATRAINQTLGRAWRHKEDFALGFLLDARYHPRHRRVKQLLDRLSPWLKQALQPPNRLPRILSQIDAFFAQKHKQ